MASSRTRAIVLLCSTDPAVLACAEALIAQGYSPIRCSSLKEFQREHGEGVVAVVLDADLPRSETYGIYRELRKESKTPLLVLLPPPSGGEPSWAIEVEHGEQEDFARKPLSATELVLRVDAHLIHAGMVPPTMGAQQGPPSVQTAAAMGGYGKVIAVYGAHGGIGKTTVAVHLAVGLVKSANARVALIDGDLWTGDTLVALNLTSTRSIMDATSNGLPHDPVVWNNVLTEHQSGLKVLTPPAHLEDVERVPEGAVDAAASGLRRYYDFVVVDLDEDLYESTMKVLEHADLILLVLTPDFGALRNTVRFLTLIGRIGMGERIHVVLNRSNAGLDLKQIESVIPRPILAQVPSDGRLFSALWGKGETAFDLPAAARTQVKQAMEGLVRDVFEMARPKAAAARGEGGLLSSLWRKITPRQE